MKPDDVVPDFELPDQDGTPRSLTGFLADGPVVLFFYPAAMTAGCTKESCHFRDLKSEFAEVGAQRVGISADNVDKQKQFSDKYTFDFPLLSDPDKTVAKEFGVGPDAGITTASDYKEFTEYVDRLHEKGIHVIMAGDVGTVPVEEYNLATYFLNNDGGDYINTPEESPENWWPGNDVNLGSAVSARERDSSGLWKREFTGGLVYTVEPGADSQTVKLPTGKRWFDIEHNEVTEVTLAPGTGAVLTSEG